MRSVLIFIKCKIASEHSFVCGHYLLHHSIRIALKGTVVFQTDCFSLLGYSKPLSLYRDTMEGGSMHDAG
jgi:hypothetical protein